MPITTNDGGVLKKLGTISASDSGVIRNLSTISANDVGVLRTIHSGKKLKISGITPLVTAKDHIVIVNSGTFTLTAPAGARIIIAGGGQDGQRDSYVDDDGYHDDAGYGYGSHYVNGGSGGFVAEYTLTSDVKNAACTVTLGAAVPYSASSLSSSILKIGNKTYTSGSTVQVIQTKWGPIGGNGGKGCYRPATSTHDLKNAEDGTGAGGGGGGTREQRGDYYGKGGNSSGYGNKGGNGSPYTCGSSGSSGIGGDECPFNKKNGSKLGGGGGGGYGAGGGGSSAFESIYSGPGDDGDPVTEYNNYTSFPGHGGAGIVVIEL